MERKSSFELLRIVSMLMIVGLHYFEPNMGGAMANLTPADNNFYVTYFFESFFIVGVNCFILINGYFQINKTSIGLNKIFALLIQMLFYSAIFYGIAVLNGNLSLSLSEMVKALAPFFVGLRWFIKVYIILYVLTPFINVGLNKLDKKSYLNLIIILLVFFSLWPSFLPGEPVTDRGYGIINFVLMYAIGGYIKLHYTATWSKFTYLSGYFLSALIIFGGIILSYTYLNGFGVMRMLGYNYIFNVIGSVSLFLFFSKLELQSKFINYISKFTLGVYFIHSDPSINDILYKEILQTDKFWFSNYFALHFIISITIVYVVSTIIDILRKLLFDKIEPLILPSIRQKLPFIWKEINSQ